MRCFLTNLSVGSNILLSSNCCCYPSKMPTCIATVGLTIGDVTNSVASLMGSVSYLKAFIPIAITNIIHNRIQYDPEYFDPHKLNSVPYKTFSKRIPKNKPLFNVYHWLRAALGDLDKKYMKKLFLIVRNKDTEDIIEHYSFSINYTDMDQKPEITKDSDEVMQTTSKLFETINLLGEQHKLDEADVSFAMQVVLNDSAPDTYVTKSFEKAQPYIDPEIKDTVSVGALYTGYHKLKICAKSNVFNIDDETLSPENTENTVKNVGESNVEILSTEIWNMTDAQNIESNSNNNAALNEIVEDEDFETTLRKPKIKKRKTVPSKIIKKENPAKKRVSLNKEKKKKVFLNDQTKIESPITDSNSTGQLDIISQEMEEPIKKNTNISCLCTVNYDIDKISLIICSICEKYQHVACVGYRSYPSVPKPHVCYFCFRKTGAKISDIRMYNARSENMRFIIALLRLVSVYCNNTRSSPGCIIDLIALNTQQFAYNELSKYGVIQNENGKIYNNMAKITTTLNSVIFYKEIDSMELDSSQIISIDDS